MRENGPIVNQKEAKPSRWTTVPKRRRYVTFLPHQLLDYIRDAVPSCPVPRDAIFSGTFEVDAREHIFVIHFHSEKEPMVWAIKLNAEDIQKVFQQMCGRYLPTDFEVCGIETSPIWAWLKMSVRSERFGDVPEGRAPDIHVRYEAREVKVYDVTQPDFGKRGMLVEAVT